MEFTEFLKKLLDTTRYFLIKLSFLIYNFFDRFFKNIVYVIKGIINFLTVKMFVYLKKFFIFIFGKIHHFFVFIGKKCKLILANVFHILAIPFNFIFNAVKKFLKSLSRFFTYLGIKIKNLFFRIKMFLINNYKNILILFLAFVPLIIFFIIAIFKTFYLILKILKYTVLNKSEELNPSYLIYLKPRYNLNKSLWKSYKNIIIHLDNLDKKIINIDKPDNYFNDIVNYLTEITMKTTGFLLILIFMLLFLPFNLIILSIQRIFFRKLNLSKISDKLIIKNLNFDRSVILSREKYFNYYSDWKSSDETILESNGKRYPSNGDKTVTLKLILSNPKEFFEKDTDVIITKSNSNDEIEKVSKNLNLPSVINRNIDLPLQFENCSLEWKSLMPKYISDSGVINAKYMSEKPVSVSFKLKIICNNIYRTEKRNITLILSSEEFINREINDIPLIIDLKYKEKIKFRISKRIDYKISSDNLKIIDNSGCCVSLYYEEINVSAAFSFKGITIVKTILCKCKGKEKFNQNELKQIKIKKSVPGNYDLCLPEFILSKNSGKEIPVLWSCDNNLINIQNKKIVKPLKKSEKVIINAAIVLNNITYSKAVKIKIPKHPYLLRIKEDIDGINKFSIVKGRKFDKINLPKKGKIWNSRIYWLSMNPGVLSASGKVGICRQDTVVSLIAYSYYGFKKEYQEFKFVCRSDRTCSLVKE